jgi:hypothetical protein
VKSTLLTQADLPAGYRPYALPTVWPAPSTCGDGWNPSQTDKAELEFTRPAPVESSGIDEAIVTGSQVYADAPAAARALLRQRQHLAACQALVADTGRWKHRALTDADPDVVLDERTKTGVRELVGTIRADNVLATVFVIGPPTADDASARTQLDQLLRAQTQRVRAVSS